MLGLPTSSGEGVLALGLLHERHPKSLKNIRLIQEWLRFNLKTLNLETLNFETLNFETLNLETPWNAIISLKI